MNEQAIGIARTACQRFLKLKRVENPEQRVASIQMRKLLQREIEFQMQFIPDEAPSRVKQISAEVMMEVAGQSAARFYIRQQKEQGR